MVPNPPTPNRAVAFDHDVCIGCNSCVDLCPCPSVFIRV